MTLPVANGETEAERRQRRDDLLTYGEIAARILRDRPDLPREDGPIERERVSAG
jgi:hypothetical protein